MSKRIFPGILLLIALLSQVSCIQTDYIPKRETLDLSGSWHFALDSMQVGINEKWFSHTLSETVALPGTLDENNKGIPNLNRDETMRLSRERMYEGWAWYQKEITIDAAWEGKEIFLTLERTKPSKIWIDENYIGENNTLLSSHNYQLTDALKPGKHLLSILINNGPESVPDGIKGSHAWTEHTQTNWNGIIGEIALEARNKSYIKSVKVTPAFDEKEAVVALSIYYSGTSNSTANFTLKASSWNTARVQNLAAKSFQLNLNPGDNRIVIKYPMGNDVQYWSEFSPALYKLNIEMETPDGSDNIQSDFGFRMFATSGTQFTINGIKTFLRGENNACVFPLTAYPPMDVDHWRKLFQIAKSYGINHYRYHSWTPPNAAFVAADIEGIYMQPELPFWGALKDEDPSGLNEFLLNEGENILKQYGNHASFVLFALGNEIGGSLKQMQKMVKQLRPLAPEKLFAYGSNNYLGTMGQAEGEDFYVGCRVGNDTDNSYSTHVRASFSFADAYDGGIINGTYPSTNQNYAGAISKCSVPVVGHEIAQFQVYPNYNEMKKYTGVLKPWNFEIFKRRIEESGMGDQALDFNKASGVASMLAYRADVEMAIRTPGFGGFQLLDLQDFPGQGTALVGIMDAFMDSKGLITPEEFSQFCNRVVPLSVMEKYCWTNAETFSANIEVANYAENELENQSVSWKITDQSGNELASGTDKKTIPQGEVFEFTRAELPLNTIKSPQKLTLSIQLDGTPYKNAYSLWVYPENNEIAFPPEVLVTSQPEEALQKLQAGEKVLYFPDHDEFADFTVGGLFTNDYWNYKMFKGISERNNKPVSPGTMGILTNPEHPLFNSFPTEFHTNWQWWPIVKNSRPFILDNAPEGYKPLVQVIDNIERNHKLGLVFEFKVDKGSLLVCMSDLKAVGDKPEARQFFASLLKYMKSENFNPESHISNRELKTLLTTVPDEQNIKTIGNISYE